MTRHAIPRPVSPPEKERPSPAPAVALGNLAEEDLILLAFAARHGRVGMSSAFIRTTRKGARQAMTAGLFSTELIERHVRSGSLEYGKGWGHYRLTEAGHRLVKAIADERAVDPADLIEQYLREPPAPSRDVPDLFQGPA